MAELEVTVDASGAVSGAKKVERSLESIRKASERASKQARDTGGRFIKSGRDVDAFGKAVKRVGAIVGTYIGLSAVRKVIEYADAWTQMQNQLKLVTASSLELKTVTNELFQISQKNRASLAGTSELYARIARSSQALGLSQQEVLDTTDSVSKAIAISGVSAQAAEAAIVQLGQGLASGALRGDELRSVMEQTPRLAIAIADGLGITTGALREWGAAGKLSADVVIKALKDQASVLDKEFGQTVPTVSQAVQVFQNTLTKLVAKFDEVSGTSQGLAKFIIELADGVDLVSDAVLGLLDPSDELTDNQKLLAQAAIGVSTAFGVVFDAAKIVPAVFKDIGETLGGLAAAFGAFISGDFARAKDIWDEVGLNDTDDTQAAFTNLFEDLDARFTRAGKLIDEVFTPSLRRAREEAELGIKPKVNPDPAKAELASLLAEFDRLKAVGIELDVSIPDLDPAEADLDKVRDAVDKLKESLMGFGAGVVEDTLTPLEQYEKRVRQLNLALAEGILPQEAYSRAIMAAVETYQDADPVMQQWMDTLEEGKELAMDLRTPYEVLSDEVDRYTQLLTQGAISQDTYNRAVIAGAERLKEALEKDKDGFDFLEEMAKQAARNIQSAFADFLFDPFEDGLDGLLRNFVDILRRMAAEALAAQVFKIMAESLSSLGGGGGFWGTVASAAASSFGGGAAEGGDLRAGKTYLVGEEGPELVTTRTASATVIPNDELDAYKAREESKVADFMAQQVQAFRDQQQAKVQDYLDAAGPALAAGRMPPVKLPDPDPVRAMDPQLDLPGVTGAPPAPKTPDLPDLRPQDVALPQLTAGAPAALPPLELPAFEAPIRGPRQLEALGRLFDEAPDLPPIEVPPIEAPAAPQAATAADTAEELDFMGMLRDVFPRLPGVRDRIEALRAQQAAPAGPGDRAGAMPLPLGELPAPELSVPDMPRMVPRGTFPQIRVPGLGELDIPLNEVAKRGEPSMPAPRLEAMDRAAGPAAMLPMAEAGQAVGDRVRDYVAELLTKVGTSEEQSLDEFMTGLFGSFGGFYANGGDFDAGKPIVVGEQGPEVLTPKTAGAVTPGAPMGQAPAPEVNVPVNVVNVTDPREAVSAIESNAGTQAILNVISQNSDAIKRALS